MPYVHLLHTLFDANERPDKRTLFVFVRVRLGVALRVLQDPSEDVCVYVRSSASWHLKR